MLCLILQGSDDRLAKWLVYTCLPQETSDPQGAPMNLPVWTQPLLATYLFWAAYWGCYLPEIIGSFFQKSSAADRHEDRGSLRILVFGTMASLLVAFLFALNLKGLAISEHGLLMMNAGTVLIIAGVAFRWYSIRVLGQFFTRDVAIRENHRIIRNGPYRILRHPSYSGYLLATTGIAVALNNWAASAELLVINFAIYIHRITIEEAALKAAFGESYTAY
jgi:protein-S-isoprenylcysteine O-methyltransferase Ste14